MNSEYLDFVDPEEISLAPPLHLVRKLAQKRMTAAFHSPKPIALPPRLRFLDMP